MEKLFKKLNKYIIEENRPVVRDLNSNDLLEVLIESGFFNLITKFLTYTAFEEMKEIKNPEYIFGVLIGISTRNSDLIQRTLIKLIPGVNENFFKGVFAFIVKDMSQQKNMKAVCKKIGINGELAINIASLLDNKMSSGKYQKALSICKEYCSNPEEVACLVSMLRGDLADIRVLAETLEINTKRLSFALAFARNRLDLISDYKEVAKIIGTNNEKAISVLINVACGNSDEIYEVSESTNDKFDLSDPWPLIRLLRTIHLSNKMTKEHKKYEQQSCDLFISNLFDKLKVILAWSESDDEAQVTENDSDSEEEKLNVPVVPDEENKENPVEENKSPEKEETKADSKKEEAQKKVDPEEAKLKQNDLKEIMQLIVDSCWRSKEALKALKHRIMQKLETSETKVNDIWRKNPDSCIQILQEGFIKVYQNIQIEKSKSEATLKENLEIYKLF